MLISRFRPTSSFPLPRILGPSILASVTACSLLAAVSEVGAEPAPSGNPDSVRAAARVLGEEGLAAYREENYRVAAEKLGKAFDLVRVPTVGLWLARALVRQNQLVEAAERYQQVLQIEAPEGRISAQRQAQQDAAVERQELLRRIPVLKIVVLGAPQDDLTLQLDGVSLDPALVGTEIPVNPGKRSVAVSSQGKTLYKEITLAEAARESIELDFGTAEDAAGVTTTVPEAAPQAAVDPVMPPPIPQQTRRLEPVDYSESEESELWWRRTGGWVALGAGGVALGTWGVTALLAKGVRDDIEKDCHGTVCAKSQADDVDRYNALVTASTIGFWTGVVASAAGGYLLLSLPGEGGEAPLVPWVGVGTVGAVGRF